MSLSELPIQMLWTIASYFSHQSDIYAEVGSNRRLYQGLKKCLYFWNAQYSHGLVPSFATKHSVIPQIQTLLVGLDAVCTRPHPAPQQAAGATQHKEN